MSDYTRSVHYKKEGKGFEMETTKPLSKAISVEEALTGGGYIIDLKFYKVGTNITISEEALGIDTSTNEELSDFLNTFVKKTQISWLGNKNVHIRKAESISKSVHKRKIKDSLDGIDYIPKAKMPAFVSFLSEKKKEYLKVRDNLLESYDLDVRLFERRLRTDFLNETVGDDERREELIKKIMAKVPSRDEVYDSFKVEQDYKLFAMSSQLLAEEDKEDAYNLALERMNGINGKTLSVVFEKTSTIMTALLEKRHTKKHEKIANEIIEEIVDRNIFSHSGLENIKEDYQHIKDNQDLEQYEVFVGKVFKLAQEIDEVHQLPLDKSVFTLEQLEFLAKTL